MMTHLRSSSSLPVHSLPSSFHGGRLRSSPSTRYITSVSSSDVKHSKKSFEEMELEKEWGFVPFFVATFVSAVAVSWIYIGALAIIVSSIESSRHWFWSWCSKDFVSVLWDQASTATAASLFVLAPFSFFFYESEGFGRKRRLWTRITETGVVVLLFMIVVIGGFRILYSLWRGHNTLRVLTSLTLANLSHNAPGVAFFLLYTHVGFQLLVGSVNSMRVAFDFRNRLIESRARLLLEATHLDRVIREHEDMVKAKQSEQVRSRYGLSPSSSFLGGDRHWNTSRYRPNASHNMMRDPKGHGRSNSTSLDDRSLRPSTPTSRTIGHSRRQHSFDNSHRIFEATSKTVPVFSPLSQSTSSSQEFYSQKVAERASIRSQLQVTERDLSSLLSYPVLRNVVWVAGVVVCLLLTYHIILRSLARELSLWVGDLPSPSQFLQQLGMMSVVTTSPVSSPSQLSLSARGCAMFLWTAFTETLQFVVSLFFGLSLWLEDYPVAEVMVDVLISFFLLYACVSGIRTTNTYRVHRAEVADKGSIQSMLLLCSGYLFLTSSWPIVVWMLGVSSLDMSAFNRKAERIEGSNLLHVFLLSFLGQAVWRIAHFWYGFVRLRVQLIREWFYTSLSWPAQTSRSFARLLRKVANGFHKGYVYLRTHRLTSPLLLKLNFCM